jgi:hypothetical protein
MKKFFIKRKSFFSFACVLLVIFLLHLSYLPNGFVWVDHVDIEQGRLLFPLEHITDVFFYRFGDTGYYRPLVSFVTSIDFALYKTFTPGYHLTNVLLHLAVSGVVPLFLSVFVGLTLPEMLLAAFIMGIHPLAVLPAGVLSYRAELLYTLFTLLTVFFHGRARKSGNLFFAFAAVVSFYLALISKETAIVIIPLIIIFWELLQRKKEKKSTHTRHIFDVWPLLFSEILALGIYLLFRFRAVPEIWKAASVDLPFSDAIGTRMEVFVRMLSHFITPLRVSISDAVPIVGVLSFFTVFILVLLILFIMYLRTNSIRSPLVIMLILFLITLTPVLNIVSLSRFGSPHYGYLPLAVFSGIVLLFLRWGLNRSFIIKKSILIALCVWLFVMAWTTFWTGFQFKNDQTLFEPEVQRDPHFLEGYFYLGNWYLTHTHLKEAEDAYIKAQKTDPKILAYQEQRSILINLASVYMAKNNLHKADEILTQAEYLPGDENVQALYHNRMILLHMKHDYKSVYALSQDSRAFPYTPTIYLILADSLHNLGRDKEAAALLQTLLSKSSGEEKEKVRKLIKSYER